MSLRRRALALLAALSAACTTVAVASTAQPAAAAYDAYVMGYFTETPNWLDTGYGPHLAVSTDGPNKQDATFRVGA